MDYQITPSYDAEKSVWNVALSGEFDIFNSPELKTELNNLIKGEGKAELVLDCEELTFMDSTAIGTLVAVLKNVKVHNGSITLKNVKPSVLKLFKITSLDKIFNIAGDANG
ncbi:MAG: STAS domain-containing protein [Clostridiales bacterium]|jgi:anti-sigma B factor antagonist|nr:STAS domain-containing protein [Clostridiales bacterium]